MPLIAPDNGGTLNAAGLVPNPSGLTLADYTATPQSILEGAKAAGQLQQLSSQLALEKAQRTAAMANTNYQIALTGHLQDNLQSMSDADRATYTAQLAAARAAQANSENLRSTSLAYGQGGGATAAGFAQAQDAKNAQAGALSDFNSGFAGFNTPTKLFTSGAAQAAGSTVGGFGITPAVVGAPGAASPAVPAQPAQAPTSLAPYTSGSSISQIPAGTGPLAQPAEQAVDATNPSSASALSPSMNNGLGMHASVPGLADSLLKARQGQIIDATTDLEKFEHPNSPSPGVTTTTYVRFSKADGSKVWESDPIVTSNANTRIVQRTAAQVTALRSANTLLGQAQDALDKWKAAYPQHGSVGEAFSNIAQGLAARTSSGAATGNVSTIEKGFAPLAESAETKNLVQSIQAYGQALNKLDPDTGKGAASIKLMPGDIANPIDLESKLNASKDYIGTQMSTLTGQGDVRPDNEPTPTPAPTPSSGIPMGTVYRQGVAGTVQVINGTPYFIPAGS